jgi:hypothetical protein
MPFAVTDEGLFAREHELHGSTRLPDEQAQQAFDGHVFLAAESTAEVGAFQAHASVRQLKDLGDVAVVLEYLGAHAQGQHAFAVDPADAALGFQIDVIHEGRVVRVFDDDAGAREALADIAGA